VARVCGEDGDVFKSGAVQRLAQNRGVIGHPAVAAELGHAHGHGVLRIVSLLQGVDQLADDHLTGEADVIVGVLLPHPDLLHAAHRQAHRPNTLPVHQGREKSGHRGGDIWHQHSPQLPVLLAVLHRVGLRQAAGRLLRLGRAAQLYRLNKGLDPDAERPGGLALIHLQDQGRLAAALPQQADDLIGQNGIMAAAKADDLHVLQAGLLRCHHGAGEHPGVE
ncbi:metal-dependent hydrolase, partial [Dysosmobacter welbionis]